MVRRECLTVYGLLIAVTTRFYPKKIQVQNDGSADILPYVPVAWELRLLYFSGHGMQWPAQLQRLALGERSSNKHNFVVPHYFVAANMSKRIMS